MSDRSLIAVLCIAAVLAMIGYMTLGVRAPWSFVLPFRGEKLIALVLVALAVSTSTVRYICCFSQWQSSYWVELVLSLCPLYWSLF